MKGINIRTLLLQFSMLLLLTVGAVAQETQQQIRITGVVTDIESDTPLEGVSIKVVDTNILVKTDETGKFSLELPVGTYAFQVSAPFYKATLITQIKVNAEGLSEPLEVTLEPQVVKLDTIKMKVRLSQSGERGLLEKTDAEFSH